MSVALFGQASACLGHGHIAVTDSGSDVNSTGRYMAEPVTSDKRIMFSPKLTYKTSHSTTPKTSSIPLHLIPHIILLNTLLNFT